MVHLTRNDYIARGRAAAQANALHLPKMHPGTWQYKAWMKGYDDYFREQAETHKDIMKEKL